MDLYCRDRLERLDVSFCRQLDDASLGLLADSCPQLRQLALFGCSSATRCVAVRELPPSWALVSAAVTYACASSCWCV